MKMLPNGCRISTVSVFPRNWKSAKADISILWRITYRFYDRRYPKAKQVSIRGMNHFYTVQERQSATIALIQQEMALLEEGYNPFDKVMPEMKKPISGPRTPLAEALQFAQGKIQAVKGTLIDIKSVVRGSVAAAQRLGIADTPVSEISRRHIKQILDNVRANNPKFTNKRFNKYRAYLSRLFRELIEMELVENNPVRDIAKAKETFKMRKALLPEEMAKIAKLRETHYTFYRYIVIFFYSGSRTTELFALKREDVNLERQEFRLFVKKGRAYREDLRVITNQALPFWKELLQNCPDGHYIFSRDLKPGRNQIRPDQINRRWDKYVKKGLGIDKDFYALKHTFTDLVAEQLGIDHAATLDGHTTPVITLKNYAVGEKGRQRERIKKLDVKFG